MAYTNISYVLYGIEATIAHASAVLTTKEKSFTKIILRLINITLHDWNILNKEI